MESEFTIKFPVSFNIIYTVYSSTNVNALGSNDLAFQTTWKTTKSILSLQCQLFSSSHMSGNDAMNLAIGK